MTPAELHAAKSKGEEYLRAMASFEPGRLEFHPISNGKIATCWTYRSGRVRGELAIQEAGRVVERHRDLIDQVLKVPPADYVLPVDPDRSTAWPVTSKFSALPEVLNKSALQLQKNGDLDGALDRYIAALKFMSGSGRRNCPGFTDISSRRVDDAAPAAVLGR